MPAALPAARLPEPWDIFCRVIDNHGDLGVCWRLARALADDGLQVRLWVDQPEALAWMAPGGWPGVQVLPWPDTAPDTRPDAPTDTASAPAAAAGSGAGAHPAPSADGALRPGPVVVEAFGCDPPAWFVARMAAMPRPPVWLNLEYLSAEPYVERSHGLASPQWSGPGKGLTKWFFYPGFTPGTGGLLHGDLARPGLAADPVHHQIQRQTLPQAEPTPRADSARTLDLPWPASAPAEQRVLLFGYASAHWPGLLQALAAAGPTRLLVPPGAAQAQIAQLHTTPAWPAGLQWQALPLLPQPAFDQVLNACDLAIVRGEDSFARANLAADTPFLWQIYPQDDGAHATKLEAYLRLYLAQAPAALAGPLAQCFRALSGLAPWPAAGLPDRGDWAAHQRRWRAQQLALSGLLRQLRAFVTDKAAAPS